MATHPQTLAIATALIEEFEGIEEQAYLDPIGIPTICAGLTLYPNGTPVRLGDVCNKQICRGHLEALLNKEYLPQMELIPGWSRLGPNQQSTLLSFAWNLGPRFYGAAGFETISRVLKDGATRAEAYKGIPAALALYDKAGGKALAGLTARRKKEGEIWKKDSDGPMKFKAKVDTVLKKSPIDSKLLSQEGKQEIKAGGEIQLSRFDEIAADPHAWVTLMQDGSRWAIFQPHWAQNDSKPQAPPAKSVNWSDFSSRAGTYITVGDVLQFDARRKPKPGSAEEKALLAICKEFDAIRAAWNGPLGITSGYRPEPINRQVGGVRDSYHTRGMALDIYPIDASLDKFHNWLLKRWSGGYGDGRGRGFIHIDTRNGGKFSAKADLRPAAVWTY